MWKIRIEYDDHSKCTLTGKHKDIPLRLAKKYYDQCGSNPHCIKCEYQQYPIKTHKAMDLIEKIDELEESEYDE